MHKLHGELDLYKYRKSNSGGWDLVDHHHQTNYDTLRGRINPTFSANCYRVTRLECFKKFKYPRPPKYGELSKLPIYFNEPLFVPDTLSIGGSGTNYYALSYDNGSTWWTHDGVTFQSVTFATSAELIAVGMVDTEFEAMDSTIHADKFIDSIIIATTPGDASSGVHQYEFILKYDSGRIDPYYVRWVGDIPVIDRYVLEALPISSAKEGNTYTINISNISGVEPIELDTLLTYVGQYIGTFTYVGITVEIDEILVGSYTITELVDQDVDTQRSKNAKSVFWGKDTPTYDDGILGGSRFHGSETSGGIYTYNGGPAENVWCWPFIADKKFRRTSLSRSVWMPYTSALAFGDNIVNPQYTLDSSGGAVISCSDRDNYMSGLSFWPFYLRFLFITDGDAGTATYILYRAARSGSLLSIERSRDVECVYISTSTPQLSLLYNTIFGTGYAVINHPLLRRPDRMVPWSTIMYRQLAYDGQVTPRCAYNSFHDVIVEVYDDHLDISRYAGLKLLTINANAGETFKNAHLTLEDPSGRDLTIWYYVASTGEHYYASLPVTITRDTTMQDFIVAVTGDLTERLLYSNISSPASEPSCGLALRDMILTQDALGGTWGTAALLTELKATDNLRFSTSLHQDIAGAVSDSTRIFDQMWGYRHLIKNGSVPTSADLSGHQVATFTGSSFIYMNDGPGDSGLNMKWADNRPTKSVYLEFEPSALQDSTVIQNLATTYNLDSGGQITVSSPYEFGVSVMYMTGLSSVGPALDFTNTAYRNMTRGPVYIDPSDNTIKGLGQANTGQLLVDFSSPAIGTFRPYDAVGIAGARWCHPYFDQATSSVKIIRVHYSSANLILSSYDVDNDTYSESYTILVNGAAFTHASSAITSIYVNDSGDPILVIFSGSGWTQADGLLEVNLTTMTATKIALTGGYYQYIGFSSYNVGTYKGVTFKDSSGDIITAAARNPLTGEVAFINHTTGTYELVTLGSVGPWITTNYTGSPWSLCQVPGTSYALFILGDYVYANGTVEAITVSLLDMEARTLARIDIEAVSAQSTGVANTTYNSETAVALYPPGYTKWNEPVEYLSHCMVRSDNSYNWLHVLETRIYMGALSSSVATDSCSYSVSLAKIGTVEYPGFTLTVVDDEIALSGGNKDWVPCTPDSLDKRLSSLVIGGALSYSGSGDVSNIASYTSSNLYSGTVKNFVTKTEPVRYGAYKFTDRLHTVADIDHFFTTFGGSTTFLLHIVANNESGTYFLDTNNTGELTLITDANRGSVTPNSISDINSALSSILLTFGQQARMGLVYYDINGNTPASAIRSQTYAVLNQAVADAPPYRYDVTERFSGMVMCAKNGTVYSIPYPCTYLRTHVDEYLWTGGSQGQQGYMSVMHTPDMLIGLLSELPSNVSSAPSGSISFFGIGVDDSVLFQPLCRDTWSDRLLPRHILCSDIFTGLTDLSMWAKNSADASEHESTCFFMPSEPDRMVNFLPMTMRTLDDGTSGAPGRFSISWNDGLLSTAVPWVFDAREKFTVTTNASGSVTWANLNWYFIDGTSPSFGSNEILSFAIHNSYGYSIDNYQIVNTSNLLSNGEMQVGADLDSVSLDGTTLGIDTQAVILDTDSAMLGASTSNDTIFTTLGKKS